MITLLVAALAYLSQAQTTYNTSCGTAWFVVPGGDFDMGFDGGKECEGTTVLFFYYRATTTVGAATICNFDGYDVSSFIQTDFEVYGPYSSQSEGCTFIAGSAIPLASGSNAGNVSVEHDLEANMTYILKISIDQCVGSLKFNVKEASLATTREEESCPNCIGSFQPTEGTYILSAWVKDGSASGGTLSYTKPSIDIASNATVTNYTPTGEIIDGWQRIEAKVEIDPGTFAMKLKCASGGDCYFDDIRFFPVDGSMVTYVYDPITLRLMAELDERNYAKLYEYDEEGKLIRVKKETEKGIMTIQETRENNSGR